MMNTTIVIRKTTIVGTANSPIKKERSAIALLGDTRIRVIHSSICQNHFIQNLDPMLEPTKPWNIVTILTPKLLFLVTLYQL